jgi:hypothetical protein
MPRIGQYGTSEPWRAAVVEDTGAANLTTNITDRSLKTGKHYLFGVSLRVMAPSGAAPTGIGVLTIKDGSGGGVLASLTVSSNLPSDSYVLPDGIPVENGIYFDWSRIGAASPSVEAKGVVYYGPKG